MITAECDSLAEEGRLYAQLLFESGVEVTLGSSKEPPTVLPCTP